MIVAREVSRGRHVPAHHDHRDPGPASPQVLEDQHHAARPGRILSHNWTNQEWGAAVQGAANLSDNERQAMATMLGSINTMDYESQIALLDQAVELLQNGFEVEKVNNVWRARTGNRPATPSAPVTPSTKKFEILSVK